MSTVPNLRESVEHCIERYDARDYVEFWFGGATEEDGRIVIVERRAGPRDSHFYDIVADFAPTDVEGVARYVEGHPRQADLFIKTSLYDMDRINARRERDGGAVAGGRDEVKTIVGFALDCDAGKDDRYASQDDMWQALHRMPHRPSMAVLSGRSNHGFHAYWKLAEPIRVDSLETTVGINHIASAWRGQLCELVADVMRERGAIISIHDADNLVDRAFGVDRVLRPVGATRASGDVVRIALFESDRTFTLEELTPDGYQPPTPPRERTPRNEDSAIARYFARQAEAGNEITVESILLDQGYQPLEPIEEGNWVHPQSTTGNRTVQVSRSADGVPGVNVFSGNCPPLVCHDERNHVGRFYSIYALWVAFRFGDGDDAWRQAAAFCHAEAPRPPEDVFDDISEEVSQQPRRKPRLVLKPSETGSDAEKIARHLNELGRSTPWVSPERNRMLFQRFGEWVWLRPGPEDDPRLSIAPVHKDSFAGLISDAVRLEEEVATKNGVGYKEKRPPKEIIATVYREPLSSTPELYTVYHQPMLQPDGTIVQATGYDPRSKSWLEIPESFDPFPAVPENPTRQDARNSAARLLGLVQEFPFVTTGDRSAWLAAVLTACCRTAIDGCTPLFAFTAYNRGSGKGLLTDVMHWIATGTAKKTLPQVRNDEELRKQVTSLLLSGEPVVCWDDAKTKISGGVLDPLLTSRYWSDRLLGGNDVRKLPNQTTWTVTGNNIQFDGDTARRVVLIRLSPQNRAEFSITDLENYARVHRNELYMHALTIVSSYIRNGMPTQPGYEYKSFGAWWRTIRNAITWTGLADPMGPLETISDYNESDRMLELVLGAVSEAQLLNDGDPMPVREMLGFVEARPASEAPRFHDLLDELDDRKSKVKALGYLFRRYCNTEHRGLRLVNVDMRGNRKAWGVEVTAFDEVDVP